MRETLTNYFTEKGIELWNNKDIRNECLVKRACWGILRVFVYKITQQKYLNEDYTDMTDNEYLELSEQVKDYYNRLEAVSKSVNEILNTPEQLKYYKIAIEICNRAFLLNYKISIDEINGKNEIIISKIIVT